MKKVLAVIAVVAVVAVAGAAFAQPKGRNDARRLPPQAQQMQQPQQGQPMPQKQPGQRFERPEGFNGAPCDCGRGFDRRQRDDRAGNFGPHGMPGDFEGRGRRGMMFAPDMPEEIKAKVVEAAKLKIDLDAALSAKPIDKAKALEIFGQIQKAEQEIEAWQFGKKIERIEAFRTQQELNRKKFTEQKPEAPAPEAPAETTEKAE